MKKGLLLRDGLFPELTFGKEFGSVLDDFFSISNSFVDTQNVKGFSIDLSEDETNYYVEADIPGVKKDDVSIEVKDGQIVISAEKKFDESKTERKYYKAERYYGKSTRSIPIPKDADVDSIEAKYENGVLRFNFKKKEKEVRRIEIN